MSALATGGADLHLHTTFSDGTSSPEELVALARKKQLEVIAVTDHDTLDGVMPTHQAAHGTKMEVIAGVEFGTPYQEGVTEETHIVGLFLDPTCAELKDALAQYRQLRHKRAMEMIEKLNRTGVQIRSDDVLQMAGNGSVSRLHVARTLVKAGHVDTVGAAFRRWLALNRPGFVPCVRPPAEETIALIHRAGGVAILAHPGKNDRDAEIAKLIKGGLDAIEAYSVEHQPSDVRRYIGITNTRGLLISGGSDWHGPGRERCVLGAVRLSLDYVDALRRKAGKYAERHRG